LFHLLLLKLSTPDIPTLSFGNLPALPHSTSPRLLVHSCLLF